jgi:hypothetical protein
MDRKTEDIGAFETMKKVRMEIAQGLDKWKDTCKSCNCGW